MSNKQDKEKYLNWRFTNKHFHGTVTDFKDMPTKYKWQFSQALVK